jgi:hypothetical protein
MTDPFLESLDLVKSDFTVGSKNNAVIKAAINGIEIGKTKKNSNNNIIIIIAVIANRFENI